MKARYMDWEYDISELDKKYHELYRRAIEDMWQVLNSPAYLEAFASVAGGYSVRLQGELSAWRKQSNEAIVEQLRNECKKMIHIRGYWTSANVIGYGLPGDDIIRVNTRYLVGERAGVAKDRMERGSNCLHEISHNAGFGHDFKATARRRNSISYICGDAYKIAYWQCFPDEIKTIARTPGAKVYKRKPWWRFWK